MYKENKDKIKMTTILPSFIVGPGFGTNDFSSAEIFCKIFRKEFPMIPKVSFGFVDVRDVALAHVIALEKLEETNGKRYLLNSSSHWFKELIEVLSNEFSKYGYKLPTKEANSCMFNFFCLFNKEAR